MEALNKNGKENTIWKTINDFPTYQVNQHGVIRNAKTSYVVKQQMGAIGYLFVCLYDSEQKAHTRFVHRIVAETFVPNPEGCPIVNHIDECCVHNSADNLEWVSFKNNANHGTRNERIANGRKIPIIGFDSYGDTRFHFSSIRDASRVLGVSEASVRIAMKKHNKCKSLYWRVAFNDEALDKEREHDNNLDWIEETEQQKRQLRISKMEELYA